MQRAHARWAVARGEELAARQLTADEAEAVELFERDFDNFRAAVRWALDTSSADVAIPLVTALHEFAFLGLRGEVYGWIEETVERFSDSGHPLVTEAMGAAAVWSGLAGDAAGAEALEQRIRRAEDAGSSLGVLAMDALIGLAARRGDFATADRYLARLAAIDFDGYRTIEAAGDVAVMALSTWATSRRRATESGPS